MKNRNGRITFTSIVVFIALIIGYALYLSPKNYDILEIDAKNDNYPVVGLLIAWISLAISLPAIIAVKEKGKRLFLGIELIMSIVLLFLWWRY